MSPSNDDVPTGTLRVLSLDGGGVRGLSSLLILKYIMRKVSLKQGRRADELQPCDYFDLIGGTSTGGIIALMLGRMRMSVDDCIKEYQALSREIFSKPLSGEYKFSASNLEAILKRTISKYQGDNHSDAPLLDPRENACKTFVTSLQNKHASECTVPILRTYESGEEVDCTIWQAARATSAAATFFEPITFGSPPTEWIDAGLGYNNPGRALLMEAVNLPKSRGRYRREDIGIFLSIGTGIPETFRPKSQSAYKEWAKNIGNKIGLPYDVIMQMKEIVTASERAHFELTYDFEDLGTNAYHRFNVDQGMQGVDLAAFEAEETMAADTRAYIRKDARPIRDCVERMSHYQPYISLTPEGLAEEAQWVQESPAPPTLTQYTILPAEYNKRDLSLRARVDIQPLLRDPNTWRRVVIADIVDKRARKRLNDCYESPIGRTLRTTTDPLLVAYHVHEQTKAGEDYAAARALYKEIARAEYNHCTEDGFKVGYYWAAHRYAGMLGCLEERKMAKRWYEEAYVGRKSAFGESDTRTISSKEGLEKMIRET